MRCNSTCVYMQVAGVAAPCCCSADWDPGCSTDSGVSALHQIIQFDAVVPAALTTSQMREGINQLLPDDLFVRDLRGV